MTRTLIAAALLALSSLAFGGDKAEKADKMVTFLPAETLTWVAPFGTQDPEFSYVQGDPKTCPYQTFLRMGTGTAGWHMHDAAYSAVVVQGTWAHLYQVENEVPARCLPARCQRLMVDTSASQRPPGRGVV